MPSVRRHLPENIPKRGLSLDEAAVYCGVSAGCLRTHGPKPLAIGKRRVWDVRDLDAWFSVLHGDTVPANDEMTPEEQALEALRKRREAIKAAGGKGGSALP